MLLQQTEMLVTDSWIFVMQYTVIVTFTLIGRGREQYVRKIICEKKTCLLTTTEELHDQPQLILDHKRGVVRHNVRVVALAHGLNLFLFQGNK